MLPEHSTTLVLLFAKGMFLEKNIVYSESREPSTAIKEASESISIWALGEKKSHGDSRQDSDKQNEMINNLRSSVLRKPGFLKA